MVHRNRGSNEGIFDLNCALIRARDIRNSVNTFYAVVHSWLGMLVSIKSRHERGQSVDYAAAAFPLGLAFRRGLSACSLVI